MTDTKNMVAEHNRVSESIAQSYENSARHAQRCLDIVRDGRSKAKYRRQIARFTKAAEQARKAMIPVRS